MSSAADQAEDATAQNLVGTENEDDANDDQSRLVLESQAAEEEKLLTPSQNTDAVNVDLSNLRGTKAPKKEALAAEASAAADKKKESSSPKALAQAQAAGNTGASSKDLPDDLSTEEDLENLAELVPGLKTKQDEIVHQTASQEDRASALSAEPVDGENGDTVGALPPNTPPAGAGGATKRVDAARWSTKQNVPTSEIRNLDSMVVMDSHDDEDSDDDDKAKAEEANAEAVATAAMARMKVAIDQPEEASSDSDSSMETMEDDDGEGEEQDLQSFEDNSAAADD